MAACKGQNGQGSQNNILGNNSPFGNVNFNNGYVIVNGTKRFGPDMGAGYFQQALNSLAQPANQYSGGGGDIAVYGFNYVPSTLQLTNKWNGTWKIHGSGVTSSGIIGPAPVINCTSVGGGYFDNDSQGRFVTDFSDMCIAGITNNTTNIIQLHNNGGTRIHDNLIGTWTYLTNHYVSPSSPGFFLPFSGPVNIPLDLVGISITANFVDYQYIERNSFELLATALDVTGYDHIRFNDNFCSQVGAPQDASYTTHVNANNWPASTAESIGIAVIVRSPQSNGDFHARGNYFYAGGWAYCFLNQINSTSADGMEWKNCVLESDTTENCIGYFLTDGYSRVKLLDGPNIKAQGNSSGAITPVFSGFGNFGIVTTNQYIVTDVTNFEASGGMVKHLTLADQPTSVSDGVTFDNGVITIQSSLAANSGISNAWISSPISLQNGVDANMNGNWTQKGFDSGLNIFTWTNGVTTSYVLWARSNAGPYTILNNPGALSQLVLSSNIAPGITNPAQWVSSYNFQFTFGWANMNVYNGFTNWVQTFYNTVGGTLNPPPFIYPVTWTNNPPFVPGFSTPATNTLAVATTGATNNTTINYLLTITAGTGLALKDANGNQFATPVLGDTVPLKPGWRFTGTGVTAQAFAQ